VDRTAVAPAAVRQTGVEPLWLKGSVADVPAAVATLLEQVSGTVGVIATAADTPQLAALLDPDPRLQVLDTWQAKGMEFDGCLVVSPERVATETPAGLRSLYVAVSRATQRLAVLSSHREEWLD
jgi:hypothetical protein